jgi:hypothetical protein
MTTEQRLHEALRAADAYEPSPDLWARVERSIEDDQSHRRRVVRTLIAAGALAAGVLIAGAALRTPDGLAVDWRAMQVIEMVVLLALIVGLGPALRRFGGTFVAGVFRANPPTGRAFLALLDVAFYLVTVGYVFVSTNLADATAQDAAALASQFGDAALRIGGLLLVMGVLHVATVITLPLLGVVFTSGRRRASGGAAHTIPASLLVIAVGAIAAGLVAVAAVLVGVGGV